MLRVTHLDAVQGASEARTEPYLNTVREYWSWQRSNAPKSRPKFVQLHEKDSSPVERVLKCSSEDKEISHTEIVRAIEYQPGSYITLTGQELERNLSSSTKTIDVQQFCNPSDIDPIYFEKPYYIAPSKGGERAYALLREALTRSDRVMIAQFALSGRERIGAISLYKDLLILYQLRFAEEIVPRSNIKTRSLPRPSPTEVNTLKSVIDHFSGPFYIEDYHDDYAEQLNTLIERKIKGLPPPRREQTSANATPEEEIISALKNTLSSDQRELTSRI
jgi:DNA end-binding protein Ku